MDDANPRWQYAEGDPENGQDPYTPQDPPAPQDPYYQQQYGYDPYAQQPEQRPGRQPAQQQRPVPPQQQQPGYADPYYADPAQTYDGRQQGWIPQQQPYPDPQYAQPQPLQQPYQEAPQYQQPQYGAPAAQPYYGEPAAPPAAPVPAQAPGPEAVPTPRRQPGEDYHTEQFAFVDEDDEESEEVIDWLKFSESRTERRDERKRRGRKRKIALILLVVVALVGGTGYLWKTGRIPGLDAPGKNTAASGAGGQKRDVIVVNLRPVDGSESSTALLVANQTTGKGTTVLLPNALSLSTDDGGATTLGKQIDQGQEPTRQALNTLLGSDIKGSWRLDTPYLEILVESLGGVTVDTDTAVNGKQKDAGKVLVNQGKAQELNGQAAVAYATHRGTGEAQAKQLIRFGQVMQAVLTKMPADAAAATKTVEALNSIPDPSLPANALGASLAQLADQAKKGSYSTALLPVQPNGTLSEQATASVVKDVLGGTVKNAGASAQARVLIKDASGDKKAAGLAQAAILNGGSYTYVAGGTAPKSQPASEVLYADDARKAAADDVAKTLGLPAGAVKKGTVAANADITVVLGKDYKG
ncbi:LCP family protein [Streptomyces sp. SPB162]|uniref:LCP family protein n=1 Tax=Streptomyces sp. SPB162 TaxID=2940560 RepID=UPI0024063D8A|nr:LCP family protein [Streptomyces sp. SPB162]MDF9813228.1 anionic cell wall polymer biosynthesis LytR-Cps2A-Psr (LCP) family protein [Streptomyces sp. SPB162]